jgi:hypothetical protein
MPQNKWKNNCKTLPSGTKFTTLNVERTLHEEDLMICDEKGPLCIAGVLAVKFRCFRAYYFYLS